MFPRAANFGSVSGVVQNSDSIRRDFACLASCNHFAWLSSLTFRMDNLPGNAKHNVTAPPDSHTPDFACKMLI
jgi:hypothetical protein